ncbi:hypothetical protein A3K82_00415 [Candidatus Pacearchaeota archaeon RBG_19FT_COMBO_34_9]|nr:MAG: hypothetical protein A3K82_00415 [Candidatus Pacearchaeota archaeon RBG_19FT_COMBO_34_9]OGJ16229.1 MAG: hypothetical protein A3K74_03320 [Candidatus Pacearchaeota archaeon RBG_13_33_26]
MAISKKPNIIILISDALRPRDLSLYGYNKETDNNIKKIASESVVFCKNFAASNASDPSINSIFTGKYPANNGIIHQHPNMKDEEIEKLKKNKFWLPLYLQKKGYFTISATPLHMWFKKGFDYYMDRDPKTKTKKFLNIQFVNKILLKLPSWVYSLGKKVIKARASPYFYSCKEVVDLAVSKIEESKKPFFLFMHLVDTHCPYPGSNHNLMHGEKTIDKITSGMNNFQKEYVKKRFRDMSVNCLEEVIERRDNAIREVDRQIGRLYSFLKDKNLWKDTIFIIMSDHGDNFGEHDAYFCRGGLYDSSVHVPLIIHLPGVKSGIIKEITQSIDIAPTILDFSGFKKEQLDGKSLLGLVKGKKGFRKYAIISDGFCEKRIAVRTQSQKIIFSDKSRCYICGATHGAEKELYNLEKDSDEKNNIYKENNNLEKRYKKFID